MSCWNTSNVVTLSSCPFVPLHYCSIVLCDGDFQKIARLKQLVSNLQVTSKHGRLILCGANWKVYHAVILVHDNICACTSKVYKGRTIIICIRCNMTPIEIKEPVFIPEDKVPIRMTTRAEEWITFLKKIPKGQALATTRKELGVSASSLKVTIDRLVRNGQIPSNFYLRQHRTKDGNEKIFIINSSHSIARHKRSRPQKKEAEEI